MRLCKIPPARTPSVPQNGIDANESETLEGTASQSTNGFSALVERDTAFDFDATQGVHFRGELGDEAAAGEGVVWWAGVSRGAEGGGEVLIWRGLLMYASPM